MKRTRIPLMLAALTFAASLTLSAQDQPKTAYMVADAHMDTQWNWDIQTTIREYIPKTIRQNLHLLRTYPEYIFNFEGAIKYSWMKEYYPTEYEEVKKYIAQGRWHLTGASWDANETVIVSPESWLRNTLLGQTYYRTEFGQESTDVFLPDCFGFSYDIPTLAAHCGLIGFSSQKLGWRNHDFYDGKLKRYPFSVGLWQGIDGSRIMMAHGYGYGQTYPDSDLSENTRLLREMNESTLPEGYRYYGTGDTGGSPTIESVRAVVKGMKGSGPVTIKSATSDQLYKDYLPFSAHPELPVFDGELYMDVHGTGCYTSQAAMKLYNRQNEHLADAAERASVVSEWLGTAAYPSARLTDAWHRVILHQFHDDLPGTSIPRAYEFSWNDELIALSQFSSVLTHAVSGVASKLNTDVSGTPVVLHNTEAFAQQAIADVVMPDGAPAYAVTGPDGKKVASQVVTDSKGQRHLLVDASVPGVGFAVYGVKPASAKPFAEKDVREVENSVYSLRFDANGDICSLIDKRSGRELVKSGEAFGLVIFDECQSTAWPAWEILKPTVDKAPLKITEDVSVRLVEDGPVRTTVCVTKHYGKSTFNQYIHLYKGTQAERIDFQCEVDWHSTHSLLKANFPLAISNPEATYDLGLGSVKRGNNRDNQYEVYSHEWTDLTDRSGAYGVTIYNNCKYGWDKPDDNTIRLSLLWAPEPGRGYVYQEQQDMGWHTITYCLEGHAGELDKAAAVTRSTMVNSPLRAFTTPKHKGTLGRSFSFASSDNANITVRALKKAETGNEYIVRVYENSGKGSQQGTITFAAPIAKAVEADGTEKPLGTASFSGNGLNVQIGAFSVKTYRITFAGQPALAGMEQQPVTLPFNKRCFSFNDFRRGASFEGSNSYAAELLPADGIITTGDVRFVLGEKDGLNGLATRGDTIALPEGNYNKVYLLAASVKGDLSYPVGIISQKGKKEVLTETEIYVPEYTGFIGQWGHEGHTQPFFKDADIAYIGTHRHSGTEDEPFEYTYMFRIGIDLPAGAKAIVLPKGERIEVTMGSRQGRDGRRADMGARAAEFAAYAARRPMFRESGIVVFAATAVSEGAQATPAGALFLTGNNANNADASAGAERVRKTSLLKGATVLASTGQANEREKADNLIDGDLTTKWCDVSRAPHYATFDLGTAKTVASWRLVNAGRETGSYITRGCLLQGRNSLTEEWKTLDLLDGNKADEVERAFDPVSVRYLRLFVTGPEQDAGEGATRIYELEVYTE